jgi:hypothetical protein
LLARDDLRVAIPRGTARDWPAASRLGFLTVGTYGTRVGGNGAVTYTDGSTQSFELYDSDWQGSAPAGADVAQPSSGCGHTRIDPGGAAHRPGRSGSRWSP